MASYNIRKAVGLDWRRDPARILRVAGALDADILALQEADRRLGARSSAIPHDLLERHGWHLVPVGAGPSLGRHGNALLLGPRATLQWCEGLDLPGLEPRGAALAHLEVDGRPLTFAAVHLGLRRRDRRRQAAALAERLSETPGPVAIAGDFNEWTRGRGLEPLHGTFDIHAPGRSFHAAQPFAALDRIALSRDARLQASGVLNTPEARRASDHLPIWVDVAWPPDGHVENRTGTSD